ncbi:MAG: T9SS type B sorting domain-containing protein [Bacteroidota bacterium]
MVKTIPPIYVLFLSVLAISTGVSLSSIQEIAPEKREQSSLNCSLWTDAGPDQSICQPGGSLQLNGQAGDDYCDHYWTPVTGLSAPRSLNTQAWVSQTTTYTLTAVGPDPTAPNLIFNPDFEAGDVGFRSNYFWDDSGVLNEEAYVLTTRGDFAKWDWDRCTDHTSGSGNMMCVNASTLGNVEVWCQTINVEPNTDYIFSLWLVTLFPASPARLEFHINGEVIGPPFTANPATCVWEQNCSAWFSGNSTVADICIINLNTDSWGNDFAIDDLSFSKACVSHDEVTLTVLGQPDVQDFQLLCTPDNLFYQISFEVPGGQQAGYLVNGLNGNWQGDRFLGTPQPTNTPYSFQLLDGNGCGQQSFQGTHTCPCLTDAGALEMTPLELCEEETAIVNSLGGVVLDGNDVLRYVLHDEPGPAIGNVLATSNQPSFAFEAGMAYETTYYVTAVAGNNNGQGQVDWSDPCLSLSPSVPLRYFARPEASLLAPRAVCVGDPAVLEFQLGNGLYNLTYFDGTTNHYLTNISDGHRLTLPLMATTNFTIASVERAVSPYCRSLIDESVQVQVPDGRPLQEAVSICWGDSSWLAGQWQRQAGVYIDTFPSVLGCDSIVQTQLDVQLADTIQLYRISCDPEEAGRFHYPYLNQFGCDSLVFEEVEYQPGDTLDFQEQSCSPLDTGWHVVQLQNRYGCDSLLRTYTELLPSDTTYLEAYSCHPADTGWSIQTLSNRYGCDSLLRIHTLLLQSHRTELLATTCDPDQAGLTQRLYVNAFGCDSLVVQTTHLLPSDSTYLTRTSCDPTQAGPSQLLLRNRFGCDSTLFIQTNFIPADTTYLQSSTCDPSQAGLQIAQLVNRYGCDSFLLTQVDLLPSDTLYFREVSCDSNRVGVYVRSMSNRFGCDSTHITTVAAERPDYCTVEVSLEGDVIDCTETSGAVQFRVEKGKPPFRYQLRNASAELMRSGEVESVGEPVSVAGLGADHYRLRIRTDNGYEQELETHILEEERLEVAIFPASDFSGESISCTGARDGALEVDILSGGTPPYQYQWSAGRSGQRIEGLSADWYHLTVTDGIGCIALDSFLLEEPAPLSLSLAVSDVRCFGYSDGRLEVVAASGGVGPYEYAYGNQAFGDQLVFEGLGVGSHRIRLRDANGCEQTEVIGIGAPPQLLVSLGRDTVLALGDSLRIPAIVSVPLSEVERLEWEGEDCSGCPVLALRPLFSTTYAIEISDSAGCLASDEISIRLLKERKVYFPNVFTPNGDGVNERFFPQAGREVARIRHLRLFNRWGDLLFEARDFLPNDPSMGWDGVFRGQRLDPAVFLYSAEVLFIDGESKQFQGDVSLIR